MIFEVALVTVPDVPVVWDQGLRVGRQDKRVDTNEQKCLSNGNRFYLKRKRPNGDIPSPRARTNDLQNAVYKIYDTGCPLLVSCTNWDELYDPLKVRECSTFHTPYITLGGSTDFDAAIKTSNGETDGEVTFWGS